MNSHQKVMQTRELVSLTHVALFVVQIFANTFKLTLSSGVLLLWQIVGLPNLCCVYFDAFDALDGSYSCCSFVALKCNKPTLK